jgi:Ca2+/Na+ antiporter
MSEDISKTRDREFQYEMTKLQVDFEFAYTIMIGILAILFGLLVVSKSNIIRFIAIEIAVAAIGLFVTAWAKDKRFNEIRNKYKLFQKNATTTNKP